MESCGLCGTTINTGAIVCAGCSAAKQKFMPNGERLVFRGLFTGAILFIMSAAFWGDNSAQIGSLMFLAGTVVSWALRYATRKKYWVLNK